MITLFLSLFTVGCGKESFTVSFNNNNGDKVYTLSVKDGELVDKPTDPYRYGYNFDGWFLGNTPFDFENTPITKDISLTAKWSGISSIITFDPMGGELETTTATVNYGGSLTKPIPVKENYVFLGWFINDFTPFNFNNITIVSDTTIFAKWEPETPSNTYTVIFNKNNGEDILSITLNKGDLVPKPLDPTKVGYDFDGWYVDGTILFDFENTAITQNNLTLTAKWNPKKFNITLDAQGGSVDEEVIVIEYGDSINVPSAYKYAYILEGWFYNGEPFSFKTIQLLEDITLTARWTLSPNARTITYILDGGVNHENNPDAFYKTTKPFNLYAPTKPGYEFVGWYLTADADPEKDTAITTIIPETTDNIVLYAIWDKVGIVTPPY